MTVHRNPTKADVAAVTAAKAHIRAGTQIIGAEAGTLAVPNAADVRAGVAVDDTVGTLEVGGADAVASAMDLNGDGFGIVCVDLGDLAIGTLTVPDPVGGAISMFPQCRITANGADTIVIMRLPSLLDVRSTGMQSLVLPEGDLDPAVSIWIGQTDMAAAVYGDILVRAFAWYLTNTDFSTQYWASYRFPAGKIAAHPSVTISGEQFDYVGTHPATSGQGQPYPCYVGAVGGEFLWCDNGNWVISPEAGVAGPGHWISFGGDGTFLLDGNPEDPAPRTLESGTLLDATQPAYCRDALTAMSLTFAEE